MQSDQIRHGMSIPRHIRDTRSPPPVPKNEKTRRFQWVLSAPERIRTSDLRFRRPTLYPAELRAQRAAIVGNGSRAERAGFEPAMECEPHTRLAGECLQPLGHLSGRQP